MTKKFISKILSLALAIGIILPSIVLAQQFTTPRPSPDAAIKQVVGLTDVKINYSRPGVKGRTIWGDLVPYDKIWRTGANECTKISFSNDVKINGQDLKAGEYSLFTIPTKSGWTIIFNTNTTLWGNMGHKEEEDALRVQTKTKSGDFKERMGFSFENVTDESADVVLSWEKLQVPFTIKVNTNSHIMASAKSAINWRTPFTAANYCFQNDINLDEGYNWVTISQSIDKNYNNTSLKAQFLGKMGKKKEAIASLEEALVMGEEMQRKPRNLESMKKLLASWK